ncbi:Adenosine (5')-pentaphospho-(5'')-adenosinepyro phosphohydrolase [Salmonella enterica subsp. enterica]|nr:Adenosine (5')-pentaphospho-(5'')-adenosinepyro phosphohydrolase [Salmonella enterica subsp. enterica]
MIDDDGYRPNVGIVICNRQGQVMWARRFGQHSWQFPQGGINPGESAEQAMYRELFEEVGLSRKDVRILASTSQLVALQVTKTFGALGHKAGMYRPETKVVSFAVNERRRRNQYANQQHAGV